MTRSDPGAATGSLPPSRVTAEQKRQYELGYRHSEMNTILRRIRLRRSGEPTTRERERLAVLRAEIAAIKAGGDV